jgi:hypothetical protein
MARMLYETARPSEILPLTSRTSISGAKVRSKGGPAGDPSSSVIVNNWPNPASGCP